ncbi:MAG TPA: hypothetical protein VML19_29405 [Verrucomicrobiae bacterium]|nr:hypothetical protein [Verrucomicrobiae bacterium]
MNAHSAPNPPVILRALLLAFSGDAHCELVAGDLHEEFLCLCEQRGQGVGKRWYASQVMRSLPDLVRLRIRSGELTRSLAVLTCIAASLLLLDRLWCFVYSHVPWKDGLDRAAGFLAVNLAVLCIASAISGALARSARAAALLSLACAAGAMAGICASLSAAPAWYIGAALLAATASSLAGYTNTKWRSQ